MQATRDDGPLPDDRVDYQLACDEVLAGARRDLCIFAPDLDQQLLNRERVNELLVRLARHNASARVRILISDAGHAVAESHRLIYLARRLPSFVSIRVLPEDIKERQECWLLADEQTLLWRPDYRQLRHGILHRHDPVRSGALQRQFDEYWTQSRNAPSLRQLSI